MLEHFRSLKETPLSISISNAIRMESDIIERLRDIKAHGDYTLGYLIQHSFYMDTEEIQLMKLVVWRTFGELSIDEWYQRLYYPINNTYRTWGNMDIQQLSNYVNHTPYAQVFNNDRENTIYTYVDPTPIYNNPEMKRLKKVCKMEYTNLLEERYILLRGFVRGIHDLHRQDYLNSFHKKLPTEVVLNITSYLGDLYGARFYYTYLDSLMHNCL